MIIVHAIVRFFRSWYAEGELSRLTDRELDDLGIRREQIPAYVRGQVSIQS